MGDFDVTQVLGDAHERHARLLSGEKLVPLLAAVIAVLAAFATLLANHSSVSALAGKNEAILHQSRASDQYNYYESKRIKVQLYQAILTSGIVHSQADRKRLQDAAAAENAPIQHIYNTAHEEELSAQEQSANSERFMHSYESYEIAAALFQIGIVLVSISALARAKNLLYVAGVAVISGLYFLLSALLH